MKSNLYWITGLSGAGKTTIGTLFYSYLQKTKTNVIYLDGDSLREIFSLTQEYSLSERKNDAIGYEIEFNKEFYKFKSFRDLDSIKTEIDTLEKEIKKLNEEL